MRVYVNDDLDELEMGRWIGRSKVAVNSKRGQALLHELHAALLAMPDKSLIDNALAEEGNVCALGALGRARGMTDEQMRNVELDEDNAAQMFDCTPTLAWHVIYATDEFSGTPAKRYVYVVKWVEDRLNRVPLY